MQVHHVEDQNAFAIIGGQQNRQFSIGKSANAFLILSDSLYSDKIGAVIREIVCNAVDAHRMIGKPDLPVEVSLSQSALTIKDFGPGIADENIAEIYATYFGSTKATDDNQIGGFGLGSKAPFAYTDHFTVISCHAGTRTVYALHVGDETTEGVPSIKPMVSTPCGEETGLTVTVPINSNGDRMGFERKLRDLVRFGGLKVTLNNEPLPSFDYTGIERACVALIPRENQSLMVLLGGVVYPLANNDAYTDAYHAIKNMTTNDAAALIYMPPSSVSVTPSRESLSYNAVTIAALKEQLEKIAKRIEVEERTAYARMVAEKIGGNYTRLNIGTMCRSGLARGHRDIIQEARVGAKSVAEHHATARLNYNMPKERDLLRAALRVFKDNRAPLRKLLGRLPEYSNTDHWRDETLEDIQARYILKRMARCLSGYPVKFYRRRGSHLALETLNAKDGERAYGGVVVPTLVVGPTKQATISHKVKGVYAVIPKLTETQLVEITLRAKRFGLEVIGAIPEKKKRVKKEKPTPAQFLFHRLAVSDKGCGTMYANDTKRAWQLDDPELVQPKAYIALPGYRNLKTPDREYFGTTDRHDMRVALAGLDALVPDVAVVRYKPELERIEKLGAPRVEKVLVDKIEARLKKPKPYDGLLLAAVDLMHEADCLASHHADGAFVKALGRDRRTIHLMFGKPYAENSDADEALQLYRMAKLILFIAPPDTRAAAEIIRLREIKKAFFDKQPEDIRRISRKPFDTIEERVGSLGILRHILADFRHLNDQEREEFMTMAASRLKRRKKEKKEMING